MIDKQTKTDIVAMVLEGDVQDTSSHIRVRMGMFLILPKLSSHPSALKIASSAMSLTIAGCIVAVIINLTISIAAVCLDVRVHGACVIEASLGGTAGRIVRAISGHSFSCIQSAGDGATVICPRT